MKFCYNNIIEFTQFSEMLPFLLSSFFSFSSFLSSLLPFLLSFFLPFLFSTSFLPWPSSFPGFLCQFSFSSVVFTVFTCTCTQSLNVLLSSEKCTPCHNVVTMLPTIFLLQDMTKQLKLKKTQKKVLGEGPCQLVSQKSLHRYTSNNFINFKPLNVLYSSRKC